MDGLKLRSVCCYWLTAGAALASGSAQPEFTIAVQESEAMTAVYLEHAGPYWSLGPIFEKVRAYMLEHKSVGSLYVKYLSNPTRDASRATAMEIGFLTRGKHDATPPFLLRQRDSVTVALMHVPAVGFNLQGVCATMNTWIASQGLDMIGPVIEIHRSGTTASKTNPTIEIQVPVGIPADKVDDRPSVALAGPWPDDGRPIAVAAADEAQRNLDAASSLSRDPIGIVTADQQDDPTAKATEEFEPFTEDRTREVAWEESDALPSVRESTKKEPLSLLYDEGRYDRLARQLIPDAGNLAPAQRAWCGHLVSRIKAVGSGVRKVFPGSALSTQELTDAIVDRHQHTSRSYGFDPLDSVNARSDPLSDPHAPAKNAIIRTIDRLLWRIAISKIDAGETGRELVRILEEAEKILHSPR